MGWFRRAPDFPPQTDLPALQLRSTSLCVPRRVQLQLAVPRAAPVLWLRRDPMLVRQAGSEFVNGVVSFLPWLQVLSHLSCSTVHCTHCTNVSELDALEMPGLFEQFRRPAMPVRP